MLASFVVSLAFFVSAKLGHPVDNVSALLTTIGVTTVVWVAVTFLTPPVEAGALAKFYAIVRPAGPGWARDSPAERPGAVARFAAARAAGLGARLGVGLRRAVCDRRLHLRTAGPGRPLEHDRRGGDRGTARHRASALASDGRPGARWKAKLQRLQ